MERFEIGWDLEFQQIYAAWRHEPIWIAPTDRTFLLQPLSRLRIWHLLVVGLERGIPSNRSEQTRHRCCCRPCFSLYFDCYSSRRRQIAYRIGCYPLFDLFDSLVVVIVIVITTGKANQIMMIVAMVDGKRFGSVAEKMETSSNDNNNFTLFYGAAFYCNWKRIDFLNGGKREKIKIMMKNRKKVKSSSSIVQQHPVDRWILKHD